MKKITLLLLATVMIVGCSHKPPKPYGTAFPINHSVDAKEKAK